MRAFYLLRRLLLAAGWLAVAAAVLTSSAHGEEARAGRLDTATTDRLRPRGWSVHLDNDLFAFTHDDRDYTAGLSVTLGGRDEAGPKFMSRALDWIDGRVGFGGRGRPAEITRSFTAGIVLFTPQDLAADTPLLDDRPYANLTYLSSSRLARGASSRVAYQSSLTVGVLGMPWVEPLHRTVHAAFGSQEPRGYAHQISEGGEPTARYAVSRHRLLDSGLYRKRPYHLRLGVSGSIGYLTEASADLAFRWGSLDTPWWSSAPSFADYGGHPAMRLAGKRAAPSGLRFEVGAGVNLRLRAYNAFLQGQFRSSEVTHDSSNINRLLLEAWLGLTMVLRNDLSITYTLRHQTEELRSGHGARGFSWAGIGISQQF